MRHARDMTSIAEPALDPFPKLDMQAATAALHQVLKQVAPQASEADLLRFSESIAMTSAFAQCEVLAGARRGTAPALESLAKVNRKIRALLKALEKLGDDELIAVAKVGASAATMMRTVLSLNSNITVAYKSLADAEVVPTRKRGNQPDIAARRVAKYAATIFQHLTGEVPTFHYERVENKVASKFGIFLAGVFKALSISAKSEHHARAVCESLKKIR